MKKIYLGILLAFSINAAAQVSKTEDLKNALKTENKDTIAWIHNGIFSLGVNEGFVHNWSAGGEVASLVVNGIFRGNLTYLNHGSIWTNDIELAYGLDR